jgi:hypothetical protein
LSQLLVEVDGWTASAAASARQPAADQNLTPLSALDLAQNGTAWSLLGNYKGLISCNIMLIRRGKNPSTFNCTP